MAHQREKHEGLKPRLTIMAVPMLLLLLAVVMVVMVVVVVVFLHRTIIITITIAFRTIQRS